MTSANSFHSVLRYLDLARDEAKILAWIEDGKATITMPEHAGQEMTQAGLAELFDGFDEPLAYNRDVHERQLAMWLLLAQRAALGINLIDEMMVDDGPAPEARQRAADAAHGIRLLDLSKREV